jgi:hypothetical protein
VPQQLPGPRKIVDLATFLDNFNETAYAVGQLDLIITVDTALAYLAGALGRPVWLLLLYAPEWRWQLARDDSPWYPSMRLFSQSEPGDLNGVFERVAEALAPSKLSSIGPFLHCGASFLPNGGRSAVNSWESNNGTAGIS